MPPHSWTLRPVETTSDKLGGRDGEAAALVLWATWAVDALHYLADVDDQRDLRGQHPDVVDIAHVRWGAGTAITALDLCAAALGRLHCGATGPHELDLRQVVHASRWARLPAGARRWVTAATADPDYGVVLAARNPMTHARLPRTLSIANVAPRAHEQRTAFPVFGLPANPLDPTEVVAKRPVPARELIETARDVATRHIEAFLAAVNRGDV